MVCYLNYLNYVPNLLFNEIQLAPQNILLENEKRQIMSLKLYAAQQRQNMIIC